MTIRDVVWSAEIVKLTHPPDRYHPFRVEGTLYVSDGRIEPFYWTVPLHDQSNWERYDFSRAEWTEDALAEYRRLYPDRALVLIPPVDDDRRLRHVEIDGRYRLILWNTYRQSTPRRSVLGFAFWNTTDEREAPLFIGEDFGPSPLHAIDSDESILALLTFLTDSTDTDPADMTERQREWYGSSDCEELSANRAYAEIAATLEGDAFALLIDLPDSPAFEEET